MKQRGYRVREEEGRVSVEHRASFRLRTIVFMVVAYLGYCLSPWIRNTLVDFYTSRDPFVGGAALMMLLIPFLFGATWLLFASGEVMHCDAQELHLARRRTWGRWHRFRFPSEQVRELRRAFRGSGKNRSFTVLTFQYGGRTFDMLEDLNWTDSDRVLRACRFMGVDTIIPIDEAAGMMKDINRRGWFINPLRPDHDENPPTAQ